MSSSSSSSSTGIGFFSLLTVALIVLKLTGLIACSWWLVFAPLIAVWVIIIALVIGLVTMAVKGKL